MKNALSQSNGWQIQNLNLPNSLFNSINSDSVLRRFHLRNKEDEKVHQSTKKDLESQIRKTNYKLKLKRFRKHMIIPSFKDKENREDMSSACQKLGSEQEGQKQIQKFNTFQEYLKKKRVKNMYIKSKMKIFSNYITDRSKVQIERQISKEVHRIEQRNSVDVPAFRSTNVSIKKSSQKDREEAIKKGKMKNFTICHMILDKILGLMIEDPKYIRLKYENEDMYSKMKEQMLELIINNQQIASALKFINEDIETVKKQAFVFSWAKLKEIQRNRKPFYLLKQQKKDQLIQQIEKTLDTLKDLVETSLKDFGKPDQAYHLQQHWEHREGNIAVEKPRKLNKTQNCLRITTIQRFKPQLQSTKVFQVL